MGRPNPDHRCTSRCRHTCGEAGGRLEDGAPCTRPGGWGIEGVRNGALYLCKTHNEQIEEHLIGHYLDGLTPKQRRFVIEWCGPHRGNGAVCAERAGYNGGTRNALAVIAHNLLKNKKVRVAIDQYFEALSMPASEVTKNLTDIARANIADLITFDDKNRPILQLNPEALEAYGRLIKKVDMDPETGEVVRVELHDSLAANRELAKIHQLYTDGPVVNVFQMVTQMTDDDLQQRIRQKEMEVRARGDRFAHLDNIALPAGRDVSNGSHSS